ncbi:hypothetical protein D3C73_1185120 [compost metagenome]
MEVSISGSTVHTTARQDLNVMKHRAMTAAYTMNSICTFERFTTILVAASMPALPAALRNWILSVLWLVANCSTV